MFSAPINGCLIFVFASSWRFLKIKEVRRVLISLSWLVGLWFLGLGAKEFLLRVQGLSIEASLTGADLSSLTNHLEKLHRKGKPAKGHFVVKIPVDYRFELPPQGTGKTAVFEGSDVMHWKVLLEEPQAIKVGMPFRVVYVPSHPEWNAAQQPVVLVIYGTLFSLIGSVFLALGALLWRYRKPRFPSSSTPNPFPDELSKP